MLATPVKDVRRSRRVSQACQFIDAAQFRSLLLSHRRLQRADHLKADLQGLIDLDTGTCFVIEAEKLARDPR